MQVKFGDINLDGNSPSKLACAYLDPDTKQWKVDGLKLKVDEYTADGLALNAVCDVSNTVNRDMFSVISCK